MGKKGKETYAQTYHIHYFRTYDSQRRKSIVCRRSRGDSSGYLIAARAFLGVQSDKKTNQKE